MEDINQNLVTISNKLVTACYNLTLSEKRLLLCVLSKINNNPNDFETLELDKFYYISVQEYADLYRINRHTAAIDAKKAVKKLFGRFVRIAEVDGTVETHWVSSVKYFTDGSCIGIKWSPDIIPLISELRRNFQSYRLRFLAKMSSYYAVRYYELLESALQKNQNKLEFSIDELKKMFVIEEKYKLFADLKKRVIEKPIKDLVQNTNLNVSIHYRKNGRQISSVIFLVNRV